MAGTFNCLTSIVANGCLLDNQKQFFTFWYDNYPIFMDFCHLMDKMEKSSKILGNCFADFLPFIFQKVKNYFRLSKRHPLATIDVMQLNIPGRKS